jgi:PTH1 family peptidyl-tRNA hydrolase
MTCHFTLEPDHAYAHVCAASRKIAGTEMKLMAGLGNPGAKYAGNRHNIGFMAVDRIAADHGFTPWKRGFQGLVAEGRLGGEKLVLLKPETFMNLSGQSLGEALRFYKLTPAELIVFHDELDLAPGKCRVKQGGGHAGHNGLRSIHSHIGEAYMRIRLGIGHPGHKDAVAGYVLSDFAKSEQDWLDDLLRGLSDGAPDLAAGDLTRFQNAVAHRVAPPRSSTGAERPEAKTKDGDAPKAKATAARDASGAAATTVEKDPRSALQKLADRFRSSS